MLYRTIFLLITLTFIPVHAKSPHSFSSAKKIAITIFKAHPKTLYCQCAFNKNKEINLNSCHMQQAKAIKRAYKLEWEHMMPAENFGRQFKCWREKICKDKKGRAFKGRKCCEKIDSRFRKAEVELFNLWPSVGIINQKRSNYRYSPISGKHDTFGCDFASNSTLRKAEPANHAKGIVARANLFMADKYQVKLSKQQRTLFEIWNKKFPPQKWEKEWALKVAAIEGYTNIYITK